MNASILGHTKNKTRREKMRTRQAKECRTTNVKRKRTSDDETKNITGRLRIALKVKLNLRPQHSTN